MNNINEAIKKLKTSRQTIALTGAGISTASGIPDFRSSNGLWKKYDPSVYAHIKTFNEDPAIVWELALELAEMARKSIPNSAHLALADMENGNLLHGIITQNIDNLHRRAGSRNVINYHGTAERAVCPECSSAAAEITGTIPECAMCGKIMKPDFIFFGEPVHAAAYLESRNLASFSDVFMVIGTSAVVQPAADLPFIAKENGAYIIELNNGKTALSDYITDCFIQGPVEETLPVLISELLKKKY